jgi:alkylation response protein AidB-like acyl-CoA dehydrogenase
LEAARSLAPTIRERAAETEAERSVPADLADQLAAAGFFRLYVPGSLGGPEADPATAFEVIETLCAADGSTGWTSFILNTSFFTSWLEPAVAKEMLSTVPDSGMAGLFGPLGRAVPDGDGALRLTGRWPFNSGSPHASWFCQGAFVFDGDAPRMLAAGMPDWRFCFVPASDAEILDTWRVSGLRGTASNDVTCTDVRVPDEHTANPIFSTAPHDGPLFRWSFFGALASLMAGFPMGVARRALDEFTTLATTKSRGSAVPLADTDVVALAVVRAEASLRAARAFILEAIGEAWDHAEGGDRITLAQRVALKMAAHNAMRAGLDVVNTVFSLAGGGALYDDSPLQRCWRDINAGSHHIFFSDDHILKTGRAHLGRPTDDWLV